MSSPLHPVEKAGALDNPWRRFFQKPKRLLSPFIKKGMTVLDFGCGPGFFTFEIAKLLSGSGKVIAADLQTGMLEKVAQKFRGHDFEKCIRLHKCSEESLNLTEKVDFVWAFYSMHELSRPDRMIRDLTTISTTDTIVYIAEQKFHVPRKSYNQIIARMMDFGFEIIEKPRVFLSRTAAMKLKSM